MLDNEDKNKITNLFNKTPKPRRNRNIIKKLKSRNDYDK